MFRRGLRTFATTALRSAEASTAYNTKVSTAQGWVNGLTEGKNRSQLPMKPRVGGLITFFVPI
jgi:cysteine synthase A